MFSDPKLKDAFRKSIKFYFANQEPKKYNEAAGNRKYDKKYFDGLEGELFPKEKEPKKAKKQKKEAIDGAPSI